MNASALVLLFCVIGQPTPSPEESAVVHDNSGKKYFEQDRYDDALREFQEAYRLAPTPSRAIMIMHVGEAIRTPSTSLEYAKQWVDSERRANQAKDAQKRLDAASTILQKVSARAHQTEKRLQALESELASLKVKNEGLSIAVGDLSKKNADLLLEKKNLEKILKSDDRLFRDFGAPGG